MNNYNFVYDSKGSYQLHVRMEQHILCSNIWVTLTPAIWSHVKVLKKLLAEEPSIADIKFKAKEEISDAWLFDSWLWKLFFSHHYQLTEYAVLDSPTL